jgi:hypothetical protein
VHVEAAALSVQCPMCLP